ncbi:MAG: hypothetical protein GEU78_13465 [Actinobacteria bacterium]|nr:hypothetical protein [Actinomycetota bacterium]
MTSYNALVGGLDAPEVVVDCFHIIRLGNQVVDEVRRRVQQETLGHRGHAGDPLYGIRRLLLSGEERLTDRGRERIRAALAAGDPDDEVWYAWCDKSCSAASTGPATSPPPATRWPSSTTPPRPPTSPRPTGSRAPSAAGNARS